MKVNTEKRLLNGYQDLVTNEVTKENYVLKLRVATSHLTSHRNACFQNLHIEVRSKVRIEKGILKSTHITGSH